MITYLAENKTFYLENERVTYAFDLFEGKPSHLYFGQKVHHDTLSHLRVTAATSCEAYIVGNRMSHNHVSHEVPVYGQGEYREPMITYETETGDLIAELEYASHRVIPQPKYAGMPFTFGGETLEVTLTDAINGVDVILSYTLFDDVDAVTRTCRIENKGPHTVRLSRAFSFSFDLYGTDYDVISLHGCWANERKIQRTPVHRGVYSIDSKRVSSSASLNPVLAVVDRTATETQGRVWGVNLVYPSSFRLFVEGTQNGRTRVGGGINDFCFSWKLEGGETFQTPEVVLAFSNEGIGGMSRVFHDTYRKHLINPAQVGMSRPLVVNNWEATYFNFDKERLCAIIDASAGLGIDTFVLDDGWFGKRDDDHSGLGDWFVNTKKLVGGLKPIIDHCHEKGMKFGLWFEPEMVNPDSDLYRAHPDWAIHCPGHTPTEARNQYVLDITRPEVRDYIVKVVSDILDNHEIDYVKWDFNRNITEMFSVSLPADRQREFAHRYALGLYDLCERLIFGHPNVFFEGCSSGGARFDPAMLYYFAQSWTSDDTDAVMRTRIQYGTSLCYPLSSQSCHVSVCPNHQTGRITPISARADIAHLGATGYELEVSRMSDEERNDIPRQVSDYRKMENLVLHGDFYRLISPFDNRAFAVELVAKDKSEAHVTYMQILREFHCESVALRLQGLDPDALYRLEGTDETWHGSTLMEVGILTPIHTMRDFHTQTYHFKKV